MEKIVQTAGRNTLGDFAPDFAHFNDDVLFGENWNNRDIDHKTRCIITVVALMSSGVTDSSLKYHLENAKKAGVTKAEIAAIITHVAFYVGWPKGWAVFYMAKEVWAQNEAPHGRKGRPRRTDGFPHRRAQRRLCPVFHRPELPRPGIHQPGGHLQRDL